MADESVPVVIVGGGPVGLCASICLSRWGVKHILIEKHPSTTLHPKARGLGQRSMEYMRPWGLQEKLGKGALPLSWGRMQTWMESLAGKEVRRVGGGKSDLNKDTRQIEQERQQPRDRKQPRRKRLSPETGFSSAQDVFEPVWLEYAETFPEYADIRFGVTLEDIQQAPDGGDGAVCTIRKIKPGTAPSGGGLKVDWGGHNTYEYMDKTTTIKAQYVLGCDGWHSTVRKVLNVNVTGEDNISKHINVFFHADLSKYCDHRGSALFWVTDARGVLQPLDGKDRWCCQIAYSERKGQKKEDFDEPACRAWIHKAIGDPEFKGDIEIRSINAWEVHGTIADNFKVGRVFLIGDCAHQIPPTGGFGLNGGVADTFNVCWKIAAVLKGWAGPGLLDTYNYERQLATKMLRDWAVQNTRNAGAALLNKNVDDDANAKLRKWTPAALDLGQVYEGSPGIFPDGSPFVELGSAYKPSGRPGGRMPHMTMKKPGQEVDLSTLDLVDGQFTLLTPPAGSAWASAATSVSKELSVPLEAYRLGTDLLEDEAGEFQKLCGVEENGAILVRPDGHIAWRCPENTRPGQEGMELKKVMESVLLRQAQDAVPASRL